MKSRIVDTKENVELYWNFFFPHYRNYLLLTTNFISNNYIGDYSENISINFQQCFQENEFSFDTR